MRRWFLAAAAATVLTAAMSPAGALPLDPGAVRPAAEAVNPIENTACWRGLERLGLVPVWGRRLLWWRSRLLPSLAASVLA